MPDSPNSPDSPDSPDFPDSPFPWEAIPEAAMPALTGTVLRRFVSGEKLTLARVHFAADSAVEVHSHPNEQFTLVLSGTMEFTVDGKPILVQAGEMLHLPSGIPHGARSLGEATVLDVFAPPRADWQPE